MATIHSWQPDVKDRHIRFEGCRESERMKWIERGDNLKSAAAQKFRHRFESVDVVIDQHDAQRSWQRGYAFRRPRDLRFDRVWHGVGGQRKRDSKFRTLAQPLTDRRHGAAVQTYERLHECKADPEAASRPIYRSAPLLE